MNALGKKIILLVDDEVVVAEAIAQIIKNFDYDVMIANSGNEAIEIILGRKAIDLILMDIGLGDGIEGIETAEIILRDRDIPIVFLSSHAEPYIVEKTERIASYGYIVKGSSEAFLAASLKMAFKLFDANQKVKAAKDKLEATLNALPDLMFEVGLDGTYYDYHSPFTELLYKPISEIIGKKIKDILPPNVADIVMSAIQEARENELSVGKQFEMTVPAGTLWFELSVARKGSKSIDPHFIVLKRDITKRKKAEAAAKAREERFQTLFDRAIDGIMILTPGGKLIDVNESYAKMHGYSKEEMRTMDLRDLDTPETSRLVPERMQRILTGESIFFEVEHYHKDGHIFPLEVSASLIVSDGEPLVQTLHRDITERKQAEAALRESEEKFRHLIWDMQVGVLLQGTQTEIILSNPKALEFLGIDEKQLLGKTSFDPDWNVIHEDGTSFPSATHPVPQAIANRHPVRGIVMGVYRPANRDRIWLLVDAEPQLNNDGTVKQVVCSFIDITQRKEAEDKIKSLLAEKELILKEAHHRIKNNMVTMTGLLILQANAMKDPIAITALNDASSRMQSMGLLYDKLYRSENLLEISINEYLSPLIDEILGNFANSLTVKVEKKIDDFILHARMLQPLGIIVNELLTNIMKYAFIGRSGGLITVGASLRPVTSGDTKTVSVVIQDNGNGLPESVDFKKSTGFGLTLVRLLTKQLGGSIRIERENGTRIILEFVMSREQI